MSIFTHEYAAEEKAKELSCSVSVNYEAEYMLIDYKPDKEVVGHTYLQLHPWNNYLGNLYGSYINVVHRGKGYGNKKHEACLAIAKAAGCETLLCTVNNTNEPQLKILQKFGWREVCQAGPYAKLYVKELV